MAGGEADQLPALQRFLETEGRVDSLQVMADGHAGLTFGFELTRPDGTRKAYILKKSPAGVPRRGSADVFRQAEVLRTLSAAGFPAPRVPWASENDAYLGAPFVIMERLPGRTFIAWDPAPSMLAALNDPAAVWLETARLMGALHAFDWREALSGWEEPTDLGQELERWTRLLRHTEDKTHLAIAQRLAAQLGDTVPAQTPVGLIHGDLQPGNVLFEGPQARGLIDWDLAAIGPLGLDVGWLMMMADAQSWPQGWRPVGAPSPAALLGAYQRAGGAALGDLAWHHAFANFRLTAITGLNLKLHRDGRRPDAIWERFYAAAPFLLARGLALATKPKDTRP